MTKGAGRRAQLSVVPDVAVRSATIEDLPALVPLFRQLVGDDEDAQALGGPDASALFATMLADPQRVVLVATDEGVVVGTADVLVVANLTHRGRPWAIVENLVVDDAHRHGGIGRLLMEWVVDHCRRAGCYKVQLLSRKDRAGAHAFYRALGFSAAAEGFRRYFD
jgi:GNAT superfamily N-acetyltransferase